MGGPNLPAPPKPPAPPSLSSAAANQASQQAGQRQAQGYQSTILTSMGQPLGDTNVGKKSLLGG